MLPGVTLKTFVVTDYSPDTANTPIRCGFSCLLFVSFVSIECGSWGQGLWYLLELNPPAWI